MALTNEQIIQELKEAMVANTNTKKQVNEALTHALTAIQNMEKKSAEMYERGCNDTWELAKKIVCRVSDGNYDYDGDQLYAKVEAYEEAEKNKLIRGDEVTVHYLDGNDIPDDKAIFWAEDDGYFYVLYDKEYLMTQKLHKHSYTLTKTGRHVDIFDELKEVES